MHRRWLTLLILLTAAGLRLVGLATLSPPGPSHDEVANWLIVRSILAGRHTVYFTEAYGHEAGFHYLQAAFVALLGDNLLALRLPAAFCGLLLVAVTYTLNRRLFGRRVALLSAAVSAAVFWPVFFSRQGLRAISLPLTAALAGYFFWNWLRSTPNDPAPPPRSTPPSPFKSHRSPFIQHSNFPLAVFFTALSAYTYMASRALPFFFAGLVVYLALFDRSLLARRWRGLVLFAALVALLAWPLVATIQAEPAAEIRIGEVNGPLRALLAGDWRPVGANAGAVAGMFGWEGDPLWRSNIAGRPVFAFPMALLFYGGVGLAFWRLRDRRYAFLLIWLAAAALPSVATIEAPSTIRMILFLPFLATFPALFIHRISSLSTVFPPLSTKFAQNLGIIVLTAALLVFPAARTSAAIFGTWPVNDEVAFVWQTALTAVAADLDHRPELVHAAVAGWSPETMDAPTMALTMRRENVALRHAGTVGEMRTVILPGGDLAAAAFYRPAALPLAPALEEALAALGVEAVPGEQFVRYAWRETLAPAPERPADETFGGELRFLGYDQLISCLEGDGTGCALRTYWRVEAPAAGPRAFFAHLVAADGTLLAQADGLEAPARFWQPGDLLIHLHTLPAPAAGTAAGLRLGVYEPLPPFSRLALPDGRDHLALPGK